MGSLRRKWGVDIGGSMKRLREDFTEQVEGARKSIGKGFDSLARPVEWKKLNLQLDLPKVDVRSIRKRTRALQKVVLDNTDEESRFYAAVLLPTLIANYFFGRYFGPLTAVDAVARCAVVHADLVQI